MQGRAVSSCALALLTALAGCGSPEVTTVAPPGSPSHPVGPAPTPLPPMALPPATDAAAIPAPAVGGEAGPKCAEDVRMAEQIPLDLMLLVDRSSSMIGPKWTMSQAALSAFLRDTKSAGLGVGLQFFPLAGTIDTPCGSDADCGIVSFGTPRACFERKVCLGPGTSTATVPPSCGRAGDPPCAAGTTCLPLGRCTGGAVYCSALGGACPGGAGTCLAIGKTCVMSDFSDSCNPRLFNRVSVDIDLLPAATARLVSVLAATNPDGGTPMVQAVQGTVPYMRDYLATHPGHRMALILATDGFPSTCGAVGTGDALGAVVAEVAAARMMSPSITTYAIGVFDPKIEPNGPVAVNRIAVAGGTDTAFVVAPNVDLSARLLEALEKIRGAALPCEFKIPAPASGTIDYSKVNVHFKGSTGEEDLLYVIRADRCDPVRGGWYYDVDPAAGTPQNVVVCPATCQRFKADGKPRVDLGFGCKTRIIE
jgi:hypothetical protein